MNLKIEVKKLILSVVIFGSTEWVKISRKKIRCLRTNFREQSVNRNKNKNDQEREEQDGRVAVEYPKENVFKKIKKMTYFILLKHEFYL